MKTKLYTILLSIIGLSSFISLLLMAAFNQPIADDVSYFQYIDNAGFGGFMYWHYFEHSGRLLQSAIVALGYWMFGDWSVKIMPILSLIGFCASLFWLLTRLHIWKRKSPVLNGLVAVTLGSVALLLMPSTYDSYLWWTSSSIYLVSLTFLMLNVCIVHKLIKDSPSRLVQIALLTVMAFGQTLSEITSVLMLGSSILALAYFAYIKNRKLIGVFAKTSLALTVGFFITYFSPGSMARRASDDGQSLGFNVINMFVLSIKHFFELIATMSLWEVAVVIGLGAIFGALIKPISKKGLRYTVYAVLVAMFIGMYGSFVANNYVWLNMSWRTFTLPSFVWTIALVVMSTIVFNTIYQKIKSKKLVYVVVVIFLTPALWGLVTREVSNVSFMKVRDGAYYDRIEDINKKLQHPSDRLAIHALPILLVSDATDLIPDTDKQVWWYENALKARNDIPSSTRLNVMQPPKDYCYGKSLCSKVADETVIKKILHKFRYFLEV